jgi:hypothetical protein
MDTINIYFAAPFAWMFAGIAVIFAFGLLPKLASRFYPASPAFRVRLAAPIIFALLAVACALGIAIQTLSAITIAGLTLIIGRRRRV